MCSAVGANIIVAQRYSETYTVEQYFLDGAGEVAIVAIDSNARGRVAAHFERLICAAARDEYLAAQREIEKERLREKGSAPKAGATKH